MKQMINPPKPWWRMLLLLLVCLLAGSSPIWAATREFKYATESNTVVHVPTVAEPYLAFTVLYYDCTDGHNGFFMHQSPSGVPSGEIAGPALFIDDNYICTPDDELAWPGSKGTGNSDGAKSATSADGWWKYTYTKTVDGVTYTVKFYNPYKESNAGQSDSKRLAVTCLVFMDKVQLGKTYEVKIAGYWKINNTHDPELQSYTWTFSGSTMGLTQAPTAEIVEYGKIKVSGGLLKDYGPTVVGSYSGATTDNLKWVDADKLDSPYGSYPQGDVSYKDLAINFSERANYAKESAKYVEYIISRTDFTPNGYKELNPKLSVDVYQWFKTTVPGYLVPNGLTVSNPDQWTKQVTLAWNSTGSYKGGSWSVYRYKPGSSRGVPVTEVNNNVTTCVVDVPELDAEYIYEVAFIPTNGVFRSELSTKTNYTLARSWGFNSFTATVDDAGTAFDLSWTHSPIEDAAGNKAYSLILQRSENYNISNPNAASWKEVKTFSITSDGTTTGSHTDNSGLVSNHTYSYRLTINLLDTTICSNVATVKLGGSKITAFSATRGTYSNMVKLEWNVKQVGSNVTNFILQRRPLGSTEEQAWANIHKTSGTASGYSYDDVTALPGSFNEYKVIVWSEDGDSMSIDDSQITDGFSLTTGSISGNITYGTGTAVDGVKVTLKQQNVDGNITSSMRSLRLKGTGAGLAMKTDTKTIQSLFRDNFSIQMYVNPNSAEMNVNGKTYYLVDVYQLFSLCLMYDQENDRYQVGAWYDHYVYSDLYIPANKWTHLTFVHNKSDKTTTVYATIDGEIHSTQFLAGTTLKWKTEAYDADAIGVMQYYDHKNEGKHLDQCYKGYVDEFRFFTKTLDETDILRNYNHPLAGNELGLAIYYPFDEGLKTQNLAYDFSKTNGISNGHHAVVTMVPAEGSVTVPSEDQLSLMSYTDVNGYFEVRGVPFSGEGSGYSVVPTLGIHEFSPSTRSCYVSMSSLNHSGVNFEDISSFPVSGKVFYDHTDYPVEGVNFYVDGTLCSKDGEVLTTNKDGEFTISVPIGDHFIRIEKPGHVFAHDGRYPADPNNTGLRLNFNREIKNLEFFDETLVNFTGRVVGGSIEGDKTVGFGLSKNNIGVAELVLTPQDPKYRMNVVPVDEETSHSYETNLKTLPIASQTDNIKSRSWRGAGMDDCNKLIIHTDTTTGEFSALVPPLQYSVAAIKVYSSKFTLPNSSTVVDLTNPQIVYTDSIEGADGKWQYYQYNTQLVHTYYIKPSFTVVQKNRTDGSFGVDSVRVTDELGDIDVKDIYSVDSETHAVSYKYGAPLFIKDDPYTFLLEGFEEYINADDNKVDHVPLDGAIVTINNALSDVQSVYNANEGEHKAGEVADLKENQLTLDSLGCATYKWMAGYPNITSPYTRTISMNYKIGDRTYDWDDNGMEGIILGELPTGNNFVTEGPDRPLMVLRDPPGTNSFTEWTSGSTTVKSHVEGITFKQDNQLSFKHKFGFKQAIIFGSIALGKEESVEQANDFEVGIKMEAEGEDSKTYTSTISTTKTISTSAAPEYVGAQGDVFIGNTSNIIFGKARNVGFQRTTGNNVELRLEDIVTTGVNFPTMFMYTQNYIENVMFPNYKLMRQSLLTTADQATIDSYQNNTNHWIYLTTLDRNDENFGKDSTYVAFPPKPENLTVNKISVDTVQWINTQLHNWKTVLENNERAKVEAYEAGKTYLKQGNISFDSGTTYKYAIETSNDTTTTWDWKVAAGVVVDDKFGLVANGFGFEFHVTDETLAGKHETDETSHSSTTAFSYTLAEDGDDDALTVDVFDYDNYGPIFRTRGGQTSCPYEGKVETKYYKPGTVIMEATMQIEVPQIDVDVPVMTDIPTGGTANYTLRLSNASEIDEDVYYRLLVADETNPNGAALSIDGKTITDNRVIKIPAGTTITKALQLKQTNTSILDYENIAVVLASQCQYDPTSTWDVITDTVYISAHFVPSSSEVDLALSNTLMNTQTGTNLELTFSGFDRNYRGLKAFRLQYKKQGSSDWTQLHEYVTDSTAVTQNNELLPKTGASVTYMAPLASFADGNYLFRVVSVSTYGTGEVYRYSDEIALTKDMARPRPLGQPEPTDGVLDIGDELSVTFNEAFLKGDLTKEKNFKVTGVLNGAEVAHETALSMQNTESTAQTEASIMLANKDFSIDAWVNLSGAGTILSHGAGTNKFTVSTDANGKLVVGIADSVYTSKESVPTGKWVFLTLNYQAADNGGNLSASVAVDGDPEIKLFSGKGTVVYEGNGPLTVGKQMNGAIHELLLWDEAHDLTTALLNRSVTKNPSTRHLIGYWKMDEGEGTTIRDYARSRHMTMADETWYLNNENKAISFDGNSYLKFLAADSPYNTNDDYAVEFWMQAGQQTAEAQLLQAGEVALWLNTDGQLKLTTQSAYNPTDETSIDTNSGVLTDNVWHHVALSVLRQGAAAVYVDGKRCLSTNASNVSHIATDNIIVGARRVTFSAELADYNYDRAFNGLIDEVRIWDATINADKLAADRKVRLTGKEDGLVAYYPFEKKQLDSGNQVETVGSVADLTGSGHTAQFFTLNSQTSTLNYSDNAPALRTKPTETNVSFNFTASDTKVVIDIDENPDIIAGCTLNFTVRDVRDENGNFSLPVSWSAFINQNELLWADDVLSIELPVETSGSMTATIVNKSGTQQMWTLSGMPSWLQASTEYGTTNPRSESQVTFTVSAATPIGKYEETVYLKSNNGIETPLTVSVKVTGDTPLWSVNAADYEETMNIFGSVYILDVPSEDTDDMVGAFIGDECRGVAQPVYNQRYDSYFVTMDIYGNGADSEEPIEFKMYDASTGTIYPVVKAYLNGETTPTDIVFEANSLLGRYDNPVKFVATDEVEQSIELAKGWNWISLGVKPDDFTVENVFAKANGKVEFVKSNTESAEFDGDDWLSEIIAMNNREMYAVQTNDDLTLKVTGHRVKQADEPISVKDGWSWVAFNPLSVMSLADALADMQPQDDEIIKGQRGVAYYDSYEWSGSLKQLSPGLGYKIFGKEARTFTYPSATAAGARKASSADTTTDETVSPTFFEPVDYHQYPGNMVIIARLVNGSMPVCGAEIGVFAGSECRQAAVTDDKGMIYITVPGSSDEEGVQSLTMLSFLIALDGELMHAAETVAYETDAVCGKPRSPFVIDLSTATGIQSMDNGQMTMNNCYDLQGRKINDQFSSPNSQLRRGIYIVNGQKKVK